MSDSTAKHTPGPWKYGVRSDRSIWVSLGGEVPGPHYQFDWYGSEADACLAMTSLEMLVVLKATLADFEAWSQIRGGAGTYRAAMDRIEATIAKAEGR